MFPLWSTNLSRFGIALLVACLVVPCVNGQAPALTLSLDSISVSYPDTSFLTLWLTNPADSITAFEFWIQLNRPDEVKFVPVSSPGVGYDSAGTLVGGWRGITLQSIVGNDFDLRVLATANQGGNPVRHDIGPSSVPRPLIRLAVAALPVPDTMSDRVAIVMWPDFASFFSFARPDGSSLLIADALRTPGLVGNGCAVRGDIDMNGTGYEPADYSTLAAVLDGTIAITEPSQGDMNHNCVVDSADLTILACVSNGDCPPPASPAFACCAPVVVSCCIGNRGNVDCDPAGSTDIGDLTALINNLFVTFDPLCCTGAADCNADGGVDIGDLTVLINNLFVTFEPIPACYY